LALFPASLPIRQQLIMHKILIICGPTATGKTAFGTEIAKKFNGEIISADSRQVYTGMDIVTGKDLLPGSRPHVSNLKWQDRKLKYYIVDKVKIWLYDIDFPNKPFNVAFWHEAATLVISDLQSRKKIPIITGGTGLFLKSVYQPLSQISISPNLVLREKLAGKSANFLFNYLNCLDPVRSAALNQSDRCNPRRLIRAIEICLYEQNSHPSPEIRGGKEGEVRVRRDMLQIGLTAPFVFLKDKVDKRISDRLDQGAMNEFKTLIDRYGSDLPSMSACGYRALKSQNYLRKWEILEHQYLRRQLTWFKKQPNINWFDISSGNWQISALNLVTAWYNKNS
jgi:tRNA dimethylallyltransferase